MCLVIACMLADVWANAVVIAHRGASAECPENTLASVKRAWEIGADAVEIDVYPTGDRRAIVIHDGNTSRTTGKDYVVTATMASTLRELDAGKWKGAQFAGEKLPFLEEVLATLLPNKQLFIELKGDTTTVEPVVRVLKERADTSGIVVISFSLAILKEFKKQMPEIPAYWLRSTLQDPATKKSRNHPMEWLDEAVLAGLQGIDVHYAGLTQQFIEAAHQRSLKVYLWTVNNPTEGKRFMQMGVDGVTTDRPRELMTVRGQLRR